MNEDRDNVRVDLLKFRRKAYLSYPPGSPERKHFLKTVLQNELILAKNDMSQDVINLIIDGDKIVVKDTIKQCIIRFVAAILCAIVFVVTRPIIHNFAFVYLVMSTICSILGFDSLYDYWKYYKSINVVKKYSNGIKQQMNRITNDIKRLEGPQC
jgi:hypothetical protein